NQVNRGGRGLHWLKLPWPSPRALGDYFVIRVLGGFGKWVLAPILLVFLAWPQATSGEWVLAGVFFVLGLVWWLPAIGRMVRGAWEHGFASPGAVWAWMLRYRRRGYRLGQVARFVGVREHF